jgi:hypothetical protein
VPVSKKGEKALSKNNKGRGRFHNVNGSNEQDVDVDLSPKYLQ